MTFGAAGFSTAASPELVGVVAAVPVPPVADPEADLGDSPSLLEPLPEVGVVTTACATEFLRLAPFFERVLPTGAEVPLPRLRFLITSVLRLSGRTTPWSLRNKPQALQSGWPSGLRRHSGVVWVKQLVQVVGTPLLSLPRRGLPGREGAVEAKADSGGEEGED